MKLDNQAVLRPPAASILTGSRATWREAALITVAAVCALVYLFFDTAASIVDIWWRSETFAHGFLIVPVSVYLIWEKRHEVARIAPAPDLRALVLLVGAGLLWLLAEIAQVQVVRQLAFVSMIPVIVALVLGFRVAWALVFPLGFLFLGVPMGEALISPLMDFTADFTVAALQLTGIPVFREGNFFAIPSGRWSVVEGCSGIRYLVASATAGVIYAYLTYKSTTRRLVFVALSVVVPILANGFRAYMIVMVAHLSDMKLALGFDHFVYGWVWFGIVTAVMFWAGSFWSDRGRDDRPVPVAALVAAIGTSPVARVLVAALIGVFLAGTWPAYAAYLDDRARSEGPVALASPQGAAGWVPDLQAMTDWRPRYRGADASVFQVYRKGDRQVALYLGYYHNQRQGSELINSTNVLIAQKHPVWSDIGSRQRAEAIADQKVDVRETRLSSSAQRLLVWEWLAISGTYLTNPYVGKLLLARDKLLGRGDDGLAIILATPYEEGKAGADETLREFVRDMLPAIAATAKPLSQ